VPDEAENEFVREMQAEGEFEATAIINEEKTSTASSALKPVKATAKATHGDAPACTTCGHTTVRNGTCYKCLNCGTTTGCV
jgi:rubrerythrin